MSGPIIPNFDDLDDFVNLDAEEPEGIVVVESASGARVELLNQTEADFYTNIVEQYQTDNKFTNISDKLELDRLLGLETLFFRQQTWVMRGVDYVGRPLPKDIQKNQKSISEEIRHIKIALGIDKKTRDGGKGTSVAEKWEDLANRAKEFGYHRNEQVIKAHTILKEIQAKMTLWKNCTNVERTEFECHLENIADWLFEKFEEFDAIDEAFQKEQSIWIKEIAEY